MGTSFPEPRSAYIHVPFCAHRCGYCDFTLVAGKDHLIERYLCAMELELRSLVHPRTIDTLFFGGGTPTHLSAGQLARLMEMVLHWLKPVDGSEFSVEANPAGLDQAKIDVLATWGVNRVSLGVQSFDPSMLELLERDHRAAGVFDVVDRLKSRFNNISFDLMFGVPGQTLTLWRKTLRQAVELGPQHISTYGLTFEKGTSFWARRQRRALVPLDEELERAMYAAAMDELPAAGFEQYEISNFALPGYASRHNENYWKGLSYYGFGPGAARYVNGRRETNHRSVTTWIKRVLANQSPIGDSEQLSDEARAREAIVLGLRRQAGIQRDEFRMLTGFDLDQLAGETIARHGQSGLLVDSGSDIRLTHEGRFLADSVFVDFL